MIGKSSLKNPLPIILTICSTIHHRKYMDPHRGYLPALYLPIIIHLAIIPAIGAITPNMDLDINMARIKE
jgi:hypothetical protein